MQTPLAETITTLRREFSTMRDELEDAHGEISQLREEVATWRERCAVIATLDLAKLRRQIAFHCHPDRGGEAGLMCQLNVLFDALTGAAS